jgi:hypothetical protein
MMRAFGVCQDYQRYVLMRRIYSNRQVLELMTEFWENHLNVPLNGEPCYLFRARTARRCGPGLRPVRGHPVRRRDAPGDARLPRQQQLHRRAPQREPRP